MIAEIQEFNKKWVIPKKGTKKSFSWGLLFHKMSFLQTCQSRDNEILIRFLHIFFKEGTMYERLPFG